MVLKKSIKKNFFILNKEKATAKLRKIISKPIFSLSKLNYNLGNLNLLKGISGKLIKKKVVKRFFKRFLKKVRLKKRTKSRFYRRFKRHYKLRVKKRQFSVVQGVLHFKFTSTNNTMVTLTDLEGNVKACYSGGLVGFKGSNKSTKYAKELIVEQLILKAKLLGYSRVNLHFNGVRVIRRRIIKTLRKAKLKVVSINEFTGISHNGCRASKVRRI